jgi:hypothetical protein
VDIETIAGRLYGLSPEDFTAERDAEAKKALDPDARKQIKGLRKPTVAAHAVNTLVRENGGDVDALLDLGGELRAAMGGDAQEIRRLSEQRRSLITGLVDRDLPAAVQQDVTATLEAATADPDLGAAVRSGRLVKPLRYAGFGAMPDLDDAMATPLRVVHAPPPGQKPRSAGPRSQKKPPVKPAPQAAAPPKPDPGLTAARERVLELAGAADDAQRRYETAVKTATEARKVLEQAESERAAAHKAARAAHADAEKARRELGRLERS